MLPVSVLPILYKKICISFDFDLEFAMGPPLPVPEFPLNLVAVSWNVCLDLRMSSEKWFRKANLSKLIYLINIEV